MKTGLILLQLIQREVTKPVIYRVQIRRYLGLYSVNPKAMILCQNYRKLLSPNSSPPVKYFVIGNWLNLRVKKNPKLHHSPAVLPKAKQACFHWLYIILCFMITITGKSIHHAQHSHKISLLNNVG